MTERGIVDKGGFLKAFVGQRLRLAANVMTNEKEMVFDIVNLKNGQSIS